MPKYTWIWTGSDLQLAREIPLDSWGRSVREGDGVFESLLVKDGTAFLAEQHFQRLALGLRALGIRNPFDSVEDFSTLVRQAVEKSNPTSFNRVRLQVSRREEGPMDSSESNPLALIDVVPLEGDPWITQGEIRVGLLEIPLLGFTQLSSLKTCNRLPYLLAERHALREGWDDCLLEGPAGMAESVRSNLWWIVGEIVHTPPLSSGCIDGTLRKLLLRGLPTLGIEVRELPCEAKDLHHADCIFLTNAIRGVQPISDEGPLRGNPQHSVLSLIREHAIRWRNEGISRP